MVYFCRYFHFHCYCFSMKLEEHWVVNWLVGESSRILMLGLIETPRRCCSIGSTDLVHFVVHNLHYFCYCYNYWYFLGLKFQFYPQNSDLKTLHWNSVGVGWLIIGTGLVSIHLCLLVGESDLSYADLNYTDLDYVGMDWCWIIVAKSKEKLC